MPRLLTTTIPVLVLSCATAFAQGSAKAATNQAAVKKAPLVEFEMMTWPEVKAALEAGKTTALFYTGGTEQRGPQGRRRVKLKQRGGVHERPAGQAQPG